MDSNLMRGTILFALAAILICSGCVGGGNQQANVETITVAGSTTVLPIAQKTAEAYMDTHPNADIQVSGGGSSVGVKSVGEGTMSIGMASRDLKDSEKEGYPDLVQHVVAKDGIALIVYASNPIDYLTVEDVKSIYDGSYTNWNEVGGDDMEIVVIGRDSASGTREFFWEHVMGKDDFTQDMLEMNSNGAVKQQVSQTPGAIGYVGLGYIDDTVKAVDIDTGDGTAEATVANVLAGEYPIARSLNMFTDGQPTGLAKSYLDYIMSPEGQAIVGEEGFVPVT